jgi:hypothetical protein
MKTIRVPAVAAIALLAACGGSGNAALSKSFNYGAPQAPTTAETSAASSAQANLASTTSFSAGADATKGAAIAAFADTLASAALGGTAFGLAPPSSAAIGSALRSAADFSTCTTVTANTVTFNNCSQLEGSYTFTLSGSISATAGSVTWNISGGFSGTDQQGVTVAINLHQSGTFTVTATKVTGHSTSEIGGSVSSQGQTISFGLAIAALVDLTYQTTPSYCVTSGAVEVKRVWTQLPAGATGPEFADAAVKLTWTGCNAIQVAHSQ